MTHQAIELQALGEALGLQMVDELSQYKEKFDQVKLQKEAEKIAFLLPLMENLLEGVAKDRTSVHGWCLGGTYNNVRVIVRPASKVSAGGGAGHTETQVQAFFDPALKFSLKITNEALISRIAQKITGKRDIQTGNSELDKAIHIESNDPDAIRRMLSDGEIHQILIAAYKEYPWPMITDKMVQVEHYGFINELPVLRNSLDSVTQIVVALNRRS